MEKWESESVKKRILNEFYISPTGKIRRWRGTLKEADNWISLHEGIARKITGITDGKATDALHNKGWIAIGSACYGNRIKGEPTQAQINTLFELGWSGIQDDSGNTYQW